MNRRPQLENPISAVVSSWEEQNQLEREAIAQMDWEVLERCQVTKSDLMTRLDQLLSKNRWESWFPSEPARRAVQNRVQRLALETRESIRSITALRSALEARSSENQRSLRMLQQVKMAYGSPSPESTWSRGS